MGAPDSGTTLHPHNAAALTLAKEAAKQAAKVSSWIGEAMQLGEDYVHAPNGWEGPGLAATRCCEADCRMRRVN